MKHFHARKLFGMVALLLAWVSILPGAWPFTPKLDKSSCEQIIALSQSRDDLYRQLTTEFNALNNCVGEPNARRDCVDRAGERIRKVRTELAQADSEAVILHTKFARGGYRLEINHQRRACSYKKATRKD